MIEKDRRAVFKLGCEIVSEPIRYKGRGLARVSCANCDVRPVLVSERQTVESVVGGIASGCAEQFVTSAPEGAVLDSAVRGDGSYELVAVTESVDGFGPPQIDVQSQSEIMG